MAISGWMILTALVLLSVMKLHLWVRARVIERRLDEEHDYFRYIVRESLITRLVNGAYATNPPNHWLTDYLGKHAELGLEDPTLDDLIDRYRTTRTFWYGGFGVWLIVAAALAIA